MSRVAGLLVYSRFARRAAWKVPAVFTSFPSKLAKLLFLAALLPLLLSACATEGDFGRPRPTVFTKTTDEILMNTNIVTRGLFRPDMTRDEIIMREAGHRLTRPLGSASPPAENPDGTPRAGYGERHTLVDPLEPIAVIGRELDSDHHDLTQFGQASRRALIADSQRMERLLRHDPGLRKKRVHEARARMQENLDYIESVFEELGQRLQAYHYAIEDVRAGAPEMVVADVRGSLDHLRDRVASLKYELINLYRAAVARSETYPERFALRERPNRRDEMPYRLYPDRVLPYGDPPAAPPASGFK